MTLPVHRNSKNSLGLKHRNKKDEFGKMNDDVSGRASQGGKKKRDLKEVGNTSHTFDHIGKSLFNFSQLSQTVL